MIKIEIQNDEVIIERRGQYEFHEQPAYAHTFDRQGNPNRYPQLINLQLRKDQAAYPKGLYMLSAASVYVNKYGSLALSPTLTPLTAQGVQPLKQASA